MVSQCHQGWRRCRWCQAAYMDYTSGGKTTGICPAPKIRDYHRDLERPEFPHIPDGPEYVVRRGDGDPNGAARSAGIGSWWRKCRRCQALFFAKDPGAGACPVGPGGPHEAIPQAYAMRFGEARPGFEPGWRYCRKCQGLFCMQYGLGVCPRDFGPHDPSHSREFFMRLAGLKPSDSLNFHWEKTLAIDVPVLVHAYITLDLTLQSNGTCTWDAKAQEIGVLDCKVQGAVRLLDCWDEECKNFLTFSATVAASPAPAPSSVPLPKQDFSGASGLWVKDHWPDLAPGAKAILVPSATPFPLSAALLVGGLYGVPGVAGIFK